jgi:hypothetical protein
VSSVCPSDHISPEVVAQAFGLESGADALREKHARRMSRASTSGSAGGVEFTQRPTDLGTATVAVFDDTCGNLIQIITEK